MSVVQLIHNIKMFVIYAQPIIAQYVAVQINVTHACQVLLSQQVVLVLALRLMLLIQLIMDVLAQLNTPNIKIPATTATFRTVNYAKQMEFAPHASITTLSIMELVFVQVTWWLMETTVYVTVLLCLLEEFVNAHLLSSNQAQLAFVHHKQPYTMVFAILVTFNIVLNVKQMVYAQHV